MPGSSRSRSMAAALPKAVRPGVSWSRRMRHWALVPLVLMAGASTAASVGASADTGIDWVPVGTFEIARTETTVAQFRRFVAASGMNTAAERAGGGSVYEHGWVRKPGWTWRAPFGSVPADDEPAVHVTWHEAQAFCRWAGGALPDDRQWTAAAYDEQRARPIAPFVTGRSYPFPSGESAVGAQCLDDCGPAARERAVRHGARLLRGDGHARAGSTPAGVNGLHEMGGNVWEWVDAPPDARGTAPRLTRGGSWWYGAAQMRRDHVQDKPADTSVVYIGFRCARVR